MFSNTRAAIFLPFILTVTACASFQSVDLEKATFYESAMNDKNRAPASFAPPIVTSDGESKIDPLYMRTQADYHFAVGEAFSLEGNSPKAVDSFKMTLVYDQEAPMVRLRLAAEYLKQGMIAESLAQAEEAVSKDSQNIDAHLFLGGVYSSMKMYSKALNEYLTVMKIEPKNTEAPLYIGALYSEQKQFENAVKYFESLVKNPDYTTPHLAHYYIGRVRMEMPDPKSKNMAEVSFKKALELRPDFVDALLSLGSLYSKQKKEEKAITLYREYQKENPPNSRIAEILSQVFIEKGEYQQAFEQLEVLESESDDPLNVRMKMALLLIEQKKYSLAVKKLELILKDAPDSDKVRFYLAAVYEEMGVIEDAIREYRKVPSASNYYGESIVHAAYLLKGSNRVNEAIEVVSIALKERQDQPSIFAMYASLLDEKADYKEASRILQLGLERFPKNAQLRFYNGTMYDRLGKKEMVIDEMQKVLEIDPNHVQSMNYLAFTWAEMGIKLDGAEELARKALQLEPQDGYILDTLGWVLHKANKTAEAIPFLEAAHRNQSSVSIIADHLGDAYLKQSMVEKAKKMYQRAAELETDRVKAEEIRSKIFALEKQEALPPRLPASANAPLAEHEQ